MADTLKVEGLVIAYEINGNVYPFACSKGGSITINTEFLETASKNSNVFREYLPFRKTFSISGSGLIKMTENNMHSTSIFDSFITGADVFGGKNYYIKSETNPVENDLSALPTNIIVSTNSTNYLNWANSEYGSPFLDSDLYIYKNGVNILTQTTNGSGIISSAIAGDELNVYTTYTSTWTSNGYYRMYIYDSNIGQMIYNKTFYNPTAYTTIHQHIWTLPSIIGKFTCYLDMIDNQGNYAIYSADCYLSDITYTSEYGSIPSYTYNIKGSGALTRITENDVAIVSSNKITARDTSIYKLVAIGYGGKWYYNYNVVEPSSGVFEIDMTGLNGTSVTSVYKTL